MPLFMGQRLTKAYLCPLEHGSTTFKMEFEEIGNEMKRKMHSPFLKNPKPIILANFFLKCESRFTSRREHLSAFGT